MLRPFLIAYVGPPPNLRTAAMIAASSGVFFPLTPRLRSGGGRKGGHSCRLSLQRAKPALSYCENSRVALDANELSPRVGAGRPGRSTPHAVVQNGVAWIGVGPHEVLA